MLIGLSSSKPATELIEHEVASPLMTGGAMDGEVRTKACTTPADYISRRAFSRMDGRASYSDRAGATVLGHEGARELTPPA